MNINPAPTLVSRLHTMEEADRTPLLTAFKFQRLLAIDLTCRTPDAAGKRRKSSIDTSRQSFRSRRGTILMHLQTNKDGEAQKMSARRRAVCEGSAHEGIGRLPYRAGDSRTTPAVSVSTARRRTRRSVRRSELR